MAVGEREGVGALTGRDGQMCAGLLAHTHTHQGSPVYIGNGFRLPAPALIISRWTSLEKRDVLGSKVISSESNILAVRVQTTGVSSRAKDITVGNMKKHAATVTTRGYFQGAAEELSL